MTLRPWPDGVVTLQGPGSGDEYNRILRRLFWKLVALFDD